MQSYALIGHPLGHSFSPQIHARLFALEGIDARYDLTDIAPENLARCRCYADICGPST